MSAEQTNRRGRPAFGCRRDEQADGEAHPSRAGPRGQARHAQGHQPPDPPEPRARLAARLPRRPRQAHGLTPRRHQPHRQRPDRRGHSLRGRQGRVAPGAEAEVPLHRLAQALRDRRRRAAHPHLLHGHRPAQRAGHRGVELPHAVRPRPLHQDAGREAAAHPRGSQGPRPVRGHRPRRAGHGGPGRRQHLVRPEAGLARLPAARPARGRDRPARAHRELRPRVRHRPGVGRAARGRAQHRLRLPLRLGRPRRGTRRQRRGAPRPPQRGGRVRPRAARGRGPAVRVRRHGVLGGVRLEPRDAVEVLRTRHFAAQTDPARDRVLLGRRPRLPRARRRHQGRRGAAVDGPLPRSRAGIGGQRGRPGAHLHQRRDHRGLGPDRGDAAPGPRHPRARAGRVGHRDHHDPAPGVPAAARAPPRWSRRRCSPSRKSDRRREP